MARVAGRHVVVSPPVKRRLIDMQSGMQQAKERFVTLNEVIEALLEEHDRNITHEAGA